VQDYNYRDAEANLLGEVNSQQKDNTTYGTDYRYDEHYKGLNSNGNGSNVNNNDINNHNSNNDDDIDSDTNNHDGNRDDIDTDDSQGSNGNNNDNSSDISTNSGNTSNGVESGEWYARIRHEHAISRQIVIRG
ncbi:hypothetical protein H3S73_13575, partial [Gilliamella sp. B14384G12]